VAACHYKNASANPAALRHVLPVTKDSLSVTGSTKQFTRLARHGGEVTGVFCLIAGVRIYHVSEVGTGRAFSQTGTLDDTSCSGKLLIWMKSAQGWVPVPDGVKALDGQT